MKDYVSTEDWQNADLQLHGSHGKENKMFSIHLCKFYAEQFLRIISMDHTTILSVYRGTLLFFNRVFKNSLATRKVLDDSGWLDNGDLGWIAPQHSGGRSRKIRGIVVLEGRAQDNKFFPLVH